MITGGYGIVFESLFTGSMFGAGPTRFAVWMYVLAKHRDGLVELNPALLAATLGTTGEDVRDAIAYHCAPDTESRTADHEGRRLMHVDGMTYGLVNWPKYKELLTAERRRQQNADAQARLRERKQGSADVSISQHPSAGVSPSASTSASPTLPTNPTAPLRSAVGRTAGSEAPQLTLDGSDPAEATTPPPKQGKGGKPAKAPQGGAAPSWVAHIVEGVAKLGEPIRGANQFARVGAAFKERARIYGAEQMIKAWDRFAEARLRKLMSDQPVRTGYAFDDFERDFVQYLPLDLVGSTNRGAQASSAPTLPQANGGAQ
jgi:hypothetical protein